MYVSVAPVECQALAKAQRGRPLVEVNLSWPGTLKAHPALRNGPDISVNPKDYFRSVN